jgi:hypothetical protein
MQRLSIDGRNRPILGHETSGTSRDQVDRHEACIGIMKFLSILRCTGLCVRIHRANIHNKGGIERRVKSALARYLA